MLLMAGLMLADKMITAEKSFAERELLIEQRETELDKVLSAAKATTESKPAFANEISDLLSKIATRLEKVVKLTSNH